MSKSKQRVSTQTRSCQTGQVIGAMPRSRTALIGRPWLGKVRKSPLIMSANGTDSPQPDPHDPLPPARREDLFQK